MFETQIAPGDAAIQLEASCLVGTRVQRRRRASSRYTAVPTSSPIQSPPREKAIPAGLPPPGKRSVFVTRFVAGLIRCTVRPSRFVTQIEPAPKAGSRNDGSIAWPRSRSSK